MARAIKDIFLPFPNAEWQKSLPESGLGHARTSRGTRRGKGTWHYEGRYWQENFGGRIQSGVQKML